MNERERLLKVWDEAWNEGLWYAPWSKVLETLDPAQAVWIPQPDRHSIWQIAMHLMFWREVAVRRAGGKGVTKEEVDRRNFPPPPQPALPVMGDLKRGWVDSHQQVRAAIADASSQLDRLFNLPFHDSYHIGQIMYLRSMQGLPPIE